jgi:hypothetical protein
VKFDLGIYPMVGTTWKKSQAQKRGAIINPAHGNNFIREIFG